MKELFLNPSRHLSRLPIYRAVARNGGFMNVTKYIHTLTHVDLFCFALHGHKLVDLQRRTVEGFSLASLVRRESARCLIL